MRRRKKIVIGALVAVLAGGFAAYSFAMPHHAAKERITGTIYVLPKQFTLNMRDGRYATLTAALVLAPGQSAGSVAEGGTPPPDGFGTLPEEAAIRDIITGIVTNQRSAMLISTGGRARLKREILGAIRSRTDIKVDSVLFTDVAVQ